MVLGNAACEKSLEGSRGLKSLLLIFASGQILISDRRAGMQITFTAFVWRDIHVYARLRAWIS